MPHSSSGSTWTERGQSIGNPAGLGILIDVTPAGSSKKVYTVAATGAGAASYVDAGDGIVTLVPDFTDGTVDLIAMQPLATAALLTAHAGTGGTRGPSLRCSGNGNTVGQILTDESGTIIDTEAGQTIYTEP